MKKISYIILALVLFLGIGGLAESSLAATINAVSCSYADVAEAVSSADSEDTVLVPPGSCAWSSTLSIAKGVSLIGAGSGNTKITAVANPLIRYAPTAATGALNYGLRISGFSFTLGANRGIALCGSTKYGSACESSNNMGAVAQTKIRINHNNFSGSDGPTIEIVGAFRGVVDNNIFTGFGTSQRAWGTGSGQDDWDAFGPLIYGTPDNMYFEDNTYNDVGGYMITDCAQGGRYVYRNNIISQSGDLYPIFDYHGGGASGAFSCFSGEIYGNQITTNGHGSNLLSHRGGKAIAFFNSLSGVSAGSGDIKIYTDACPLTDHYSDQLVQDSYYWINRRGVTGSLLDATITGDTCGYLVENSNFWTDDSSLNGTVGVSCGPLASRPAACVTGIGYWATNQSCSNLTGMVGINPASPIAGTLYKCTAPNTWTAYYNPYVYPHLLRTDCNNYPTLCDGDSTRPAAPTGLTVN